MEADNSIRFRNISGNGNHVGHTFGSDAGDNPRTREVIDRIDELVRLLGTHASAVPDAAQVQEVARRLRQEVAAPQPDPVVSGSLLHTIASRVGHVAVVGDVVARLGQAAAALFS
ncbi:hypothetical protein [Streptomyces cinnamoneus]|uniref:Uncharacterized protein n=1 Tax=Streptomyces cinnamoneus TaxID=53446 RepID=A0A918WIZ0_STRCJ|nr:hypothetical protein [Streptomyces cinnamoneus]GHC51986.1 hypothetical protein GCM10010507_30000 [Streptomyces cinnamoneus]